VAEVSQATVTGDSQATETGDSQATVADVAEDSQVTVADVAAEDSNVRRRCRGLASAGGQGLQVKAAGVAAKDALDSHVTMAGVSMLMPTSGNTGL